MGNIAKWKVPSHSYWIGCRWRWDAAQDGKGRRRSCESMQEQEGEQENGIIASTKNCCNFGIELLMFLTVAISVNECYLNGWIIFVLWLLYGDIYSVIHDHDLSARTHSSPDIRTRPVRYHCIWLQRLFFPLPKHHRFPVTAAKAAVCDWPEWKFCQESPHILANANDK